MAVSFNFKLVTDDIRMAAFLHTNLDFWHLWLDLALAGLCSQPAVLGWAPSCSRSFYLLTFLFSKSLEDYVHMRETELE